MQNFKTYVFFSDDKVFIQGAAATPLPLIKAMAEHGKAAKLSDVEVIHIHTDGEAPYASKEFSGNNEILDHLMDPFLSTTVTSLQTGIHLSIQHQSLDFISHCLSPILIQL